MASLVVSVLRDWISRHATGDEEADAVRGGAVLGTVVLITYRISGWILEKCLSLNAKVKETSNLYSRAIFSMIHSMMYCST